MLKSKRVKIALIVFILIFIIGSIYFQKVKSQKREYIKFAKKVITFSKNKDYFQIYNLFDPALRDKLSIDRISKFSLKLKDKDIKNFKFIENGKKILLKRDDLLLILKKRDNKIFLEDIKDKNISILKEFKLMPIKKN